MDEVVEETKEHGYVQTVWGRRRYIPGIYERNKNLYEEARRVAINTKVQGTAAEIMKQGMIALDAALSEQKIDAKILLQIHDELLVSSSKAVADVAEQLVTSCLESVVSWDVPFEVKTRRGGNWADVTK